MEKETKPQILYSETVNEILGSPPVNILRWGTTVIALVLVMFFVLAWLIKYPDTIPAVIEITTVNPPVTLVSKVSGKIEHLSVHDRDTVSAGTLMAVMETSASVSEIGMLRQTLRKITKPDLLVPDSLPEFSQLGELQESYTSFMKSLEDLNRYDINDFYGSRIASLTEEINATVEYIRRLNVKEKLSAENVNLESGKFRRDSVLYRKDVLTTLDLERSRQALIAARSELQQVRIDLSSKAIDLAEKRELIQNYRINRIEERARLVTLLKESFLNLKARADMWETVHLLVSPVDGIVSFTRFWKENQTVLADEPVLSVVPINPGDLLGRINLKMQRSGEVREGQSVNIKLSGFPYLQYGMLRGIVKSKSLLPSGEAYILEIDFPEGLRTLYGKELEFSQNMQGTAEIITADVRLLQKIFNPFRYLLTLNKKY